MNALGGLSPSTQDIFFLGLNHSLGGPRGILRFYFALEPLDGMPLQLLSLDA